LNGDVDGGVSRCGWSVREDGGYAYKANQNSRRCCESGLYLAFDDEKLAYSQGRMAKRWRKASFGLLVIHPIQFSSGVVIVTNYKTQLMLLARPTSATVVPAAYNSMCLPPTECPFKCFRIVSLYHRSFSRYRNRSSRDVWAWASTWTSSLRRPAGLR